MTDTFSIDDVPVAKIELEAFVAATGVVKFGLQDDERSPNYQVTRTTQGSVISYSVGGLLLPAPLTKDSGQLRGTLLFSERFLAYLKTTESDETQLASLWLLKSQVYALAGHIRTHRDLLRKYRENILIRSDLENIVPETFVTAVKVNKWNDAIKILDDAGKKLRPGSRIVLDGLETFFPIFMDDTPFTRASRYATTTNETFKNDLENLATYEGKVYWKE